jgi:hypothetical protein
MLPSIVHHFRHCFRFDIQYMQTRRCERNDYDISAELSTALIVHLNIFTPSAGRLQVPIGLLFTVVLCGRCCESLPLHNDDCGCGCR